MIKNFFNFKNTKNAWSRGMTYVELIVVLAIFGTMSSILLFRYGDFDKQISLQNSAQDMALQIVTAQKNAISGKVPDVEGLGSHTINSPVNPSYDPSQATWKPSYGVYFNLSSPAQFIYFIDGSFPVIDGIYDISCQLNADTECLKKIKIEKGNVISSICLFDDASSPADCTSPEISVNFTRPNTSAYIYDYHFAQQVRYKAQITISDSEGRLKKTVSVYASGKVEVD